MIDGRYGEQKQRIKNSGITHKIYLVEEIGYKWNVSSRPMDQLHNKGLDRWEQKSLIPTLRHQGAHLLVWKTTTMAYGPKSLCLAHIFFGNIFFCLSRLIEISSWTIFNLHLSKEVLKNLIVSPTFKARFTSYFYFRGALDQAMSNTYIRDGFNLVLTNSQKDSMRFLCRMTETMKYVFITCFHRSWIFYL